MAGGSCSGLELSVREVKVVFCGGIISHRMQVEEQLDIWSTFTSSVRVSPQNIVPHISNSISAMHTRNLNPSKSEYISWA